MKRTLLLTCAVAFVSSCDVGSFCDRTGTVGTKLAEKAKPCTGLPEFTVPPVGQACTDFIKKCGTADEILLDTWLDCEEQIAACQAGKENDFLSAVAACAAPLAGLSAECKAGLKL